MHGNVVYMFSLFYGKMLAEMQKKWLTYQCKQYIILTFVVNMRKCRNWQTSKTKDLVSIALVWVQVPSSAFFYTIVCGNAELWSQ